MTLGCVATMRRIAGFPVAIYQEVPRRRAAASADQWLPEWLPLESLAEIQTAPGTAEPPPERGFPVWSGPASIR